MGRRGAHFPRGMERDGGRSAALLDGAGEHAYTAVSLLDYWEAVHEPPWDVGWDRVSGEGRQPWQLPPRIGVEEWRQYWPPAATATAAEPGNPALRRLAEEQRMGAQVRTQRVARRWTQGELARRLGVGAKTISKLECHGASGWYGLLAERCFRVLAAPPPANAPAPAPVAPVPQVPAPPRPRLAAVPPPDYTCNGCRQPSWLHGPRPAPGQYTVHCNDCDAYTLIEVG